LIDNKPQGAFRDQPQTRQEFLSAIGMRANIPVGDAG